MIKIARPIGSGILFITWLQITSSLCAGDLPTTFPKSMQGEWTGISAEWGGKAVPPDIARRLKVTIKQGTILVSPLLSKDGTFHVEGEPIEFAYRIDAGKKPRA